MLVAFFPAQHTFQPLCHRIGRLARSRFLQELDNVLVKLARN